MTKARFWRSVGEFISAGVAAKPAPRKRRSRPRHVGRCAVAGSSQWAPLQHADGVERPPRGTINLEFCRVLKAKRGARDSQRRRVYAWEREVLGNLQSEGLLGEQAGRRITQAGARTAGLGYLTHLWAAHARDFRPYYRGVPYLRVGFAAALHPGRYRRAMRVAHAVPQRHSIYCRVESLRRTTLVHEVCHLLAWGDAHGPDYCAALVLRWEREFGIDRTHALAVAARFNVNVGSPRLRAR